MKPNDRATPACIALALLACGLPAHAAPPAGSGWTQVWGDEFEGGSLDLNKWEHFKTGTRRQATNTPGAVAVADGKLRISTFTREGIHYTGMVASLATFLYSYGYVEARVNFDTSPGMWSAFWMTSPTMGNPIGDPNNAGTEIDICEHRAVDQNGSNISSKVVGNIHWDGYSDDHRSTGYTSPNLDLGGGSHVYGMEWTPTHQKFYIDGVLRWTIDNGANSPVSNRSAFIWLSSEVQSDANVDWAGPIPAGGYGSLDITITKMEVDYVRVYQAAETVTNGDFSGRLAPFEPANEATWSSTGGRTNASSGQLAPTTAAGASLRQTLRGLMPHTGYTLSAWGNAGGIDPSLFLGVEDHGFPSTGQTLTSNVYAQATVPFTTGSSNRSASVVAHSGNPGSLAHVDDFLLRRHASITNGQLEAGNKHAWTSSYGGAIVANDGTSYGGDHAWKIPPSGSSAGIEQAIAGLTPNTSYRLSAWTSNGNAGLAFGVKNHGAAQVTSTVPASDWTQATVNFTTGPSATGATAFVFRSNSAQTAYADAFFLSQPLAAPWTGSDVGSVGLTGTSGRLGEKFVVQATGSNISGGSDKCHLIHRSLSGDGTITARILGVDVTSDLTKTGLMLRDSTAPNSRTVALTWNPATGQLDFLRRSTAGAGALVSSTAPGSVPDPPWLRLTRRGNTFTPYWSTDGVSWTRADAPRTLTLSSELLAGLVLATGDQSRLGEAAYDQMQLTAALPDVQITEPAAGTAHADNGGNLRLVASLTGGIGAAIQWSVVDGPGMVTFSAPTSATTYAAFSAPGIYRLRCAASSAAGTNTDDHTLHVTPWSAADASLALHLKFDEGSGTTATDSSGTGNHGVTSGTVTWHPVDGKIQGAAALNGSNAFLSVPDHASLDGTGAFTLSCWFKADTFNVASALVSKRVSDTSQNAYAILFGSGANGGRLRLDINSNNNRFSSNTVFSTGAWYHIALVFDGTLPSAERARLYVNGTLDVTAAEASSTVINSTAPLLIGRASETDTSYFDGMMDSVRFHRRALSGLEIAGLSNEVPVTAPFVSAGTAPAAIVNIPAALSGKMDVGSGPAATAQWTKTSGPGSAVFNNAASPSTTVTFNQPGSYTLRLTATSATGQVYQTLTIQAAAEVVEPVDPGTYAGWKELTWPGINDSAVTGPDADPDQDGTNNLLEWALHLDPTRSDVFQPLIDTMAPGFYFTYTRRKIAPGEVSFQVEWSDSLANDWTTTDVGIPVPISETGTRETVAVPIPLHGVHRFFRVRVSDP